MSNDATNPKLSIVVPFFNEEENVEEMYTRLKEVLGRIGEPYELIFVDDSSSDGTYALLKEIFRKDERVEVLKLRRNSGQTPALQAGFDRARGEIIISMDGDLQHDCRPCWIPCAAAGRTSSSAAATSPAAESAIFPASVRASAAWQRA